jgi:hypothetical protein
MGFELGGGLVADPEFRRFVLWKPRCKAPLRLHGVPLAVVVGDPFLRKNHCDLRGCGLKCVTALKGWLFVGV